MPKGTKVHHPRPRSRGPYTAETVQRRIVERRLAGQSERAIAKAERKNRRTVRRILSQPEYAELIGQTRTQLMELMDEGVSTLRHHLKKKSLYAACKLLEGMQAFVKRTEQRIEFARSRFDGWTKEEMRRFVKTGRWPKDKPRPY